MTTVYGICIEPGGMELDDDSYKAECPDCHSPDAMHRYWQTCHRGSINEFRSVHCEACGLCDGDGADET